MPTTRENMAIEDPSRSENTIDGVADEDDIESLDLAEVEIRDVDSLSAQDGSGVPLDYAGGSLSPPRSGKSSAGQGESHKDQWATDWATGSYEQWSRELGRRSLLSRAEETALAKLMEGGDQDARDRFIESNLKLVVSIAKRYRGCGVPMEDLIQEGNLGLIKAVDRFDWRKGCRFSTCAVTWIEGQIRRSIANLRHNIHLPLRVVAELRKINRVSDHLSHKLGRQPEPEEIAHAMDISPEHIKDLLSLPADSISLDEALDSEMDKFLSDIIEDESAVFPDDALIVEHNRTQINKAIAQLPPRHQIVLRMRYGLNGEREHTLEEIGQKLSLTRQRVWQIETSALKKIQCLDCPRVLKLDE